MAKNDINIRAGIVGKEAIKNDLGEIVGYVENYTNKLKNADFSVFNKLADKLQRADFGASAVSNMQKLGQQTDLTRQQALALTYTFNDVTASIASGISPMTILLQQGGQLTQAFGGIKNTLATILPMAAKWGAIIAAAAAAGGTAFVLGRAEQNAKDSAKTLADFAREARRAGFDFEFLQKIGNAGLAFNIDPEDKISFAANNLIKLKDAAFAARDAQKKATETGKQFAKTMRVPEAGQSPFETTGAPSSGRFLKTVRPGEGSGIQGQADALSQLNIDLTKYNGTVKDTLKLIGDVSQRLSSMPEGQRKVAILDQLQKQYGPEFTDILVKGVSFIEEQNKKVAELQKQLTNADVAKGMAAQIEQTQIANAEFIKSLLEGVKSLDMLAQKTQANEAAIAKHKDDIGVIDALWKGIVDSATRYYQIKNGDQQAAQQSPVLSGLATANSLFDKAKSSVSTTGGAVISSIFDGGAFQELVNYASTFSTKLQEGSAAFKAIVWPDASALSSNMSDTSASAASARDALSTAQSVTNTLANDAERAANALERAARSSQSIRPRDGSPDSPFPGMATGGYVSGPGTSTSDSIPAWLSSGEYVVRAAAVKRYGVGLMHAINGMAAPRRGFGFAAGGLVPPSSVAMAGGSSGGRGLTLVLDGKSFGGMSGSNDAMDALERYAIARRISSTTKRTPSRVG